MSCLCELGFSSDANMNCKMKGKLSGIEDKVIDSRDVREIVKKHQAQVSY
jgi:hypothetical protein